MYESFGYDNIIAHHFSNIKKMIVNCCVYATGVIFYCDVITPCRPQPDLYSPVIFVKTDTVDIRNTNLKVLGLQ